MTEPTAPNVNSSSEPQCQFFVVRKKRLCRMTVRPGRQYCGEHEPQPKTADGEVDKRIPCPNDPKHTCYISKLEKHLSICNARPTEQPPYIVHNINSPPDTEDQCLRRPLSQIPKEMILQVIDKVNHLYDKLVKDNIGPLPERPIHSTVLEEFSEPDRTESSRRHLRQVSRLLHLAEEEGLVGGNTCYVELGAGKGQLSYYVCSAWCASSGTSGTALLVDRASLRHKRDNKLAGRPALRVRADLAHLQLAHVPLLQDASHFVGFAKHLCGVATDFALRCVCAPGARARARGHVLATCCHHRCERAAYVGREHLQELNISGDELNVMFAIVSWATCGDGRSREHRNKPSNNDTHGVNENNGNTTSHENNGDTRGEGINDKNKDKPFNDDNDAANNGINEDNGEKVGSETEEFNTEGKERLVLTQEYREQVGRRAKQLLDWGRVLYLRQCGFDARLCYYVPSAVSPENVCIVAKKLS